MTRKLLTKSPHSRSHDTNHEMWNFKFRPAFQLTMLFCLHDLEVLPMTSEHDLDKVTVNHHVN